MPGYLIYARKSTESEDRQVQSIESQIAELKQFAFRQNLSIGDIYTESMSAKQPGRPVFNQMMKLIWKHGVQGILCWKLDRLARNPVDGSSLIWAFDKGKITEILSPNQSFRNNANDKFMMQLEFGMAKKYVDDLSENVKRGLKAKIEKGWRPGITPLGYLNDKTSEMGEKKIYKDPERFHLIKRMWNMMLTGRYSPPQILGIATNQWGLRTRQMKVEGGKPLAESAIYAILSNPFYCGLIKHQGELYPGKHEPMVSVEEFEQVQRMLKSKGNTRPKEYSFTYRGLLRCGECGAMVTAEQKRKLLRATKTTKTYIYYHCTKQKDPFCSQGSIEEQKLERQISCYLEKIHLPEYLYDWAVKNLEKLKLREKNENQEHLEKRNQALAKCGQLLANLIRLKISAENSAGSILSDEEFVQEKNRLLKEKLVLEQEIRESKAREEEYYELTRQTFELSRYCLFWFKNGEPEQRKAILSAVGSNHLLLGKMVLIQAKKPLKVIETFLERLSPENQIFEPLKSGSINRQTAPVLSGLSARLGLVEDVRTAIKCTEEKMTFPNFNHPRVKSV